MITFISGLPGHGKTLFAMHHIKEYQEAENKLAEEENKPPREVYYYGINGVTLDWHEIEDYKEWYKLPVGSIIVIDEAQKRFPSKPNGAAKPQYYTEFDEHRHSGYDIYLITQDPVNVDVRPKSMAERHFHLHRSVGMEIATLYEFQSVQYVTAEKFKRVENAQKKQWQFPKEAYGYYKSSERHTVKKRIPYKRLIIFALTVISLIVLVFYSISWMRARFQPEETQSISSVGQTTNGATIATGDNPSFEGYPTQAERTPVINSDPLTVPMYRHLIKIVSYPRIDGCMSYKVGSVVECTCNDQRGNKVKTSLKFCMSYISDGVFDYSITDDAALGEREQYVQRAERVEPADLNPFKEKEDK